MTNQPSPFIVYEKTEKGNFRIITVGARQDGIKFVEDILESDDADTVWHVWGNRYPNITHVARTINDTPVEADCLTVREAAEAALED